MRGWSFSSSEIRATAKGSWLTIHDPPMRWRDCDPLRFHLNGRSYMAVGHSAGE
jgi:hypothetical protein